MRLLGFEITRTKAPPPQVLQAPSGSGGWWPVIRESFPGAWQRNVEIRNDTVLTYHAVYACVTLIASDVSKCRVRLVEQDSGGVWLEVDSPAFSPVLRKPNHYQNRIKFYEQWVVSKLLHGNTYVLKQRDERGVVVAMYVLDPTRVRALVTPGGDVYYDLSRDNLAGLEEDHVLIPASEIIHDVMVPLYHPLCGVSPITACGIAAMQGLAIQRNSEKFFSNGSKPGGILTAPGPISDETAKRLKEHFESNFSGENAGRVAALGDGLKYESLAMKAVDAQLIEQLKWTAEVVCSTFHVPGYMVGVGAPPAYNNINALHQQYYSQCLQKLFESIELCLDEGLGLVDVKGKMYGSEFDLDDLLRMDTNTMADILVKLGSGGFIKLDEGRRKLGYPAMPGGDTAYLQQQNYSVEALAKRDAQDDPFKIAPPPKREEPDDDPDDEDEDEDEDVVDGGDDEEEIAAEAQLAAWRLGHYLEASGRL